MAISKVAVTGPAGSLGFKIAKALLSDDFEVVLLTREEPRASRLGFWKLHLAS